MPRFKDIFTYLRKKISKHIKANLLIIVIMVLLFFLRMLFYQSLIPYHMFKDSEGYINFPFRDMLHFKFSSGRTPIYSLIICINFYIFGKEFYLRAVVLLQILVSLISVIFLNKACNLIIKNKIVIYFSTILYGLSSSVMGWDNNILTESFALSGTVIFIYLVFKYLENATFKNGAKCIFLAFVLTFLRPSFLVFDVILIVFWLLRIFFINEEKRVLIKLSMLSMFAFLFIFCYSYFFSLSHQIFSISDAIPRQHLIMCIERGYYKTSSSQEFIQLIDNELENSVGNAWKAWRPVLDKFGNREISRLTKECILNNKAKFIMDTFTVAANNSSEIFPGYHAYKNGQTAYSRLYIDVIKMFESFFCVFKISHVIAIIILEFFISIYVSIKMKQPAWIHLGLWGFMSCIVISTYVGTCGEYPRTMICVLPFMYISLTIFGDWFVKLAGRSQILLEEEKMDICEEKSNVLR